MGRFCLKLWLVAVAALFVCACSSEQGGACPGTEDGTYFQMQVYNYLPGGMDVLLNGRYVGTVDKPAEDGQGNIIAPGETLFGSFPVCDKNVLQTGSGGPLSQRFCSTSDLLDVSCELVRPDNCWTTFFLTSPTAPTPSTPSDFQTPQCYMSQGNLLGTSNGQPVYDYPCQNDWVRC